jgi:O-antigen ligase
MTAAGQTRQDARPRSRQGWLVLFFLGGLALLLFVLALVQGDVQRSTRGIGPVLPAPAWGSSSAPLCVNAALQRYGTPDPAALSHTLDQIAAAGFTWIRQTFPWASIEPQPGDYDWTPWDNLVAAVVAHPAGLRLVAVLDTAPPWAIGNTAGTWDAAPPANPADLARFAAVFAARYGDYIDVYQIWDEPNLSSHWGGRDVDPAGYSALLRASAEAIRDRDSNGQAAILLAGLAPTAETGPRNISDVAYLRDLYRYDSASYFDIVAGKPYGFDSGPGDSRVDAGVLNFSRLILLRETMVAHGDGNKSVWASHWGWNALPADWQGAPSIWGQADERSQAEHTVAALQRARQQWPWAGALCLESWQPDAPPDDPRWGFALVRQDGTLRPIYAAIQQWHAAQDPDTNPPGYYAAAAQATSIDRVGAADYEGEWRFSELGADVTAAGGQSVTIRFEGTDFGLRVRRGNYRAYLYVSIDGGPANALPKDGTNAYLVLSSPTQQPQVDLIPVAHGLHDGPHTAQVRVERGWGQWPLVGWSVGWWPEDALASRMWLSKGLGALALVFAAGLAWSGRRVDWRWAGQSLARTWRGLSSAAQTGVAAVVTLTFWASAWLTWGQAWASGTGGLVATIASASLFYVSPIFVLSLLSLVALSILIILRPDLGLALVAFTAPFYLQSRAMFVRAFSVVEIALILCLIAWMLRRLLRFRSPAGTAPAPRAGHGALRLMDWGVVFFMAVAAASMFVAEMRGVALRELRIVILEPGLFYFMLRTTPLDRQSRWRLVDAFVLGAAVVALVGLYQYAFTQEIITAEGGLRRLKSVFGSPNNVGLYLGRAFPVLLAVALFGRSRRRRWLYASGVMLVGTALLLSFSKGALLLGVPAALLTLGLLAGGRWLRVSAAALVAAAAMAIPVLRTPRFTSLFDLQSGTSFFRLHLWRSTLDMIRDHPFLGVGLDNFLYAYRGRYIRPAAWQEPDLSHPHNLILDYWSRLGILGLAAGVWLQIAFWRLALPLRRLPDPDDRALAMGLMAGMVDFVAHGLVDNSYFLVDLAFAFMFSLGLVAHLYTAQRAPTPAEGEPSRPAVTAQAGG